MILRSVSLIAALTLVAGSSMAEQRHLGPHVHGQATVDVSVDGPTLQVALSIPGHDAVGFEHPPTNLEQAQALSAARAKLNAGTWLVPAAAAGCRTTSTKVVGDGFEPTAKPGGHGDFDVTYVLTCAKPDRLDALDVRLVEAFPSVQHVVTNIVTANGSTQVTLDRTTTKVALAQ